MVLSLPKSDFFRGYILDEESDSIYRYFAHSSFEEQVPGETLVAAGFLLDDGIDVFRGHTGIDNAVFALPQMMRFPNR